MGWWDGIIRYLDESLTDTTSTAVLKQCVFCDKEATDFIRLDDLDPEIMRQVPAQSVLRKEFVSIALCQKHFWKYITHPQLERNRKKEEEG